MFVSFKEMGDFNGNGLDTFESVIALSPKDPLNHFAGNLNLVLYKWIYIFNILFMYNTIYTVYFGLFS